MKPPALYELIESYRPKARFHMPSHNGEILSPMYASAPYDITELSFSDNLAFPVGAIAQAEDAVAEAVGAKRSLFFTGGSTSAIFTAIGVAKKRVSKFIIAGEVHRCVINALELFSVDYEVDEDPENAEGLIVTSPDYYGNVKDIAELRRKNPNAVLIVDEAHGAHFAYSSLLPESAVKYADFTAQSMHKTMPVYTGGALLHVNSEEDYRAARETRAKLHTSSPSYLVMASMDYARYLFEKNGEEYYRKIKEAVENVRLPEGFERVKNDDFSRLVVKVPPYASGYAVARAAEEKGVFFEMATSRLLAAIVTPFNYEKLSLLKDIEGKVAEEKDLSYLLGVTAENDIVLYPPGRVLVMKGERITKEHIAIINKERERIIGL